MYQKCLSGKGIDVSKVKHIPNADHKFVEPNNLYLIRNEVGVENYDYLYNNNILNVTKYYRILLYEWFLLVKKGGYLIFEFMDNEILDAERLRKELESLLITRGKFRVIHNNKEKNKNCLVIQKIKSIKRPADELDEWTFGIVTNGKRVDFIERAISSIRRLKIPRYEILICGTYRGKIGDDVKYIPFTEKDERGWITKKKNLIYENATYENVVVIHDRIFLNENWFVGMKKWGNYFDVLSCPVFLPSESNVKFTNWETVGPKWKKEDEYRLFHLNGHLDPRDWDPYVYVGGPIIIMKKSVWATQKWNEQLFWGDAEDIEYSLRQHKHGVMIRFNPFSEVHSLTIPGVVTGSYYEINSKKLGKLRHRKPAMVFILKLFDSIGFRRNQLFVVSIIKIAKKWINATDWRIK